MASAIDALISIGIVVTFFWLVGSRIYSHEKEHLDPIIAKIKGWINPKADEDDSYDPDGDFEIAFKGQM